MDKPKCKLCGHKHWKNEGCIFLDDAVECSGCVRKDKEIARLNALMAAQAGRVKQAADRTVYMRHYMRKRRAKP